MFVGQLVGKWEEGGWVRLITFTVLFLSAHFILLSPLGFRDPKQIRRIVRDKARVQGAMASIVEWQSLRMQEYRYSLLCGLSQLITTFHLGHRLRLARRPIPAGDYDQALHLDHPQAPSFIQQYLDSQPKAAPRLGGQTHVTAEPGRGGD